MSSSRNAQEEQDLMAAMGFANFGGGDSLRPKPNKTKNVPFIPSSVSLPGRTVIQSNHQKSKSPLLASARGSSSHLNHPPSKETFNLHPQDSLKSSSDHEGSDAEAQFMRGCIDTQESDEEVDEDVGPRLPHKYDQGEDDGAAESKPRLPTTSQAKLSGHSKCVTALSIDASGTRMLSGGRDNLLKMWDFHGMDSGFRPFRSLEPVEGNPIRDIQFSPSGDRFLVINATNAPLLYQRDGTGKPSSYNKGDAYLRDLRKTNGHTSTLTSCQWHPVNKQLFLTSSLDSTVRIWDVDQRRFQSELLIYKSKNAGQKAQIHSALFSSEGRLLIASGNDGGLQIWDRSTSLMRPQSSLLGAQANGFFSSGLALANDRYLVARGSDHSLSKFDLRKFTTAVGRIDHLPNFYEETNVVFSPDARYIATGVSVDDRVKGGGIVLVDALDFTIHERIPMDVSVPRILWHDKLNQLFCGASDGSVNVFYDRELSSKGVLLPLAKHARVRAVDDYDNLTNAAMHAVYIEETMAEGDTYRVMARRKKEKLLRDPMKTRKPDTHAPMDGVAVKGPSNQLLDQLKIIKDTSRSEDPREAILRHAQEAEDNPYWIAPAYKRTQPQALYTEGVYEDDAEAKQAAKKQRPA